MAHLQLNLLGTCDIARDGTPIRRFRSDKARALLAYLAVESHRAHARASLAALLWPEHPPDLALRNLSQTLVRLRETIGDAAAQPPFLLVTRHTIQWNPASDYVLDVAIFRAHCRNGTPADLLQAMDLYRGELLPGFGLADCESFEEWLLVLRGQLEQQAITALHALATALLAQGNNAAAEQYARRQIALDPWREEAQRQLLQALAHSGQRAAACAHYEAYTRALHTELGVQPDPATIAVFEAIYAAPSGTMPLPPTTDTDQRTAAAHEQPAHAHLPSALTPVIGRTDEAAQIVALFQHRGARLVTIMGPGGVGKTRLAVATATHLADSYADGVWWVPLVARGSASTHHSATHTGTEIANAIVDTGGIALIGQGDVAAQCIHALRSKRVLLVLDNVEHLVAGAPFITDLLQAAPHVHILVTSRERLHIAAEHVLLLDGLPMPPASASGDEANYSAVALFLERARRHVRDFGQDAATLAAVARVCRMLHGLPLGIELAAQWVADYTCDEIAHAIMASSDFLTTTARDQPERHRSLRGVWTYSWQLLAPEEQQALTRLAVFRGAFERAAAQAITGAAATSLMRLVDTSLLQRAGIGRYAMHDLLRQFAAEHLAQDPAAHAQIMHRYATYYLAWIAERANDLIGQRQQDALSAIDSTIGHIRVAWAWAVANQHWPILAAATPGMCTFYHQRGQYWEGTAACVLLIAQLDSQHAPQQAVALGQALAWHAAFAIALSQIDLARTALLRAMPLLDAPEAQSALAFAHYSMGCVASLSGDPVEARRWLFSSLATYTRHHDQAGIAKVNDMLGRIAWFAGAYTEAHQCYQQSLAIYRALGDQIGTAHALSNSAFQLVLSGQIDDGLHLIQQSQRLISALGDQLELARVQRGIADVLAFVGRYADAQALLETCVATNAAWAIDTRYVQDSLMLAFVHLEQRQYDQVEAIGSAILPLSHTLQLPRDTGFALTLLGLAAVGQGAYQQAHERLFEALQAYHVTRIRDDAVLPWVGLSHVYRARGDQQQAYTTAVTALHLAAQGRGARAEVIAVGTMLHVLLEHGELEQAIELEALVMRHSYAAHSGLINDLISKPVRDRAKHLSAAIMARAQANGFVRDLHRTVDELCARYPDVGSTRALLARADSIDPSHAAADRSILMNGIEQPRMENKSCD